MLRKPARGCSEGPFNRAASVACGSSSSAFRGCLGSSRTGGAGGLNSASFRFLKLVAVTGILAAAASVCGKLACDFGPHAAVQQLSGFLSRLLLPLELHGAGGLLVAGREAAAGCVNSVVIKPNPDSFSALLRSIWSALLLLFSGCSQDSERLQEGEGRPAAPPAASAAAVLAFLCLLLLLRLGLLGCMLACNACMLQSHVKCLVVAPSAGCSSVAIFAANFLFSVFLSWLLLGEQLTLQFAFGAACMLLGVALLSLSRPPQTPLADRRS